MEKGDDLNSRNIIIILCVKDNAVATLGPVSPAKQFHSASETAPSVKSFPAPDDGCGRNSGCWRRCSVFMYFFTPSDTGPYLAKFL